MVVPTATVIPFARQSGFGTFGGQLSLEFLYRGLCLSRFETPYVSGWYEKTGSQIYVNRGIGTTGPPIRLGARPEITVLELTRET